MSAAALMRYSLSFSDACTLVGTLTFSTVVAARIKAAARFLRMLNEVIVITLCEVRVNTTGRNCKNQSILLVALTHLSVGHHQECEHFCPTSDHQNTVAHNALVLILLRTKRYDHLNQLLVDN